LAPPPGALWARQIAEDDEVSATRPGESIQVLSGPARRRSRNLRGQRDAGTPR
jgi:hypothetical protein